LASYALCFTHTHSSWITCIVRDSYICCTERETLASYTLCVTHTHGS